MLKDFLIEKIQGLQIEIYGTKDKMFVLEMWNLFELISLYFTYRRILKRKK